jgi:hypothetical protein
MTGKPSVPIAPFAAALVPAAWVFAFQLTTRYPFVSDTVRALFLSLFIYWTVWRYVDKGAAIGSKCAGDF